MTVAVSVATTMQGEWDDQGTPLRLALLTGLPTTTSGVFDISAVEVTGDGYTRGTFVTATLGAVTGTSPTTRANTAEIVFAPNSGTTPWDRVGYVALLDSTETEVLTVAALTEWLTIGPGEAVAVPVGGLVVSV